jgi:hypothetical protein
LTDTVINSEKIWLVDDFFVEMPEWHFLVSGAVWLLAEAKKRLSAIIKDVDETCAR